MVVQPIWGQLRDLQRCLGVWFCACYELHNVIKKHSILINSLINKGLRLLLVCFYMVIHSIVKRISG